MSGNYRSGRRPVPLALIDPFCDWRDGPRKSLGERDGLRLVVRSVDGVWMYEIYARGAKAPVQSGGARWWSREDAKRAAVRSPAATSASRQGELSARYGDDPPTPAP